MNLRDYIAERDALLAFVRRQHPDFIPINQHVLEIMLHKSRTAVPALPMEMRAASKSWLLTRGYKPQDDGDVPA
jgi:hypothetical protein